MNPLPIAYRTPYPWYIEHPIHGILNTLSMVYWTSYPWYVEPRIQGILDPLPIVYRTHCSLYFNPLHMVYQSHYPWYFELHVHGISKSLSMMHGTPFHGILNPQRMVHPWYFGPTTHRTNGISNPLPWLDSKYNDETLTLVPKFHMVYWIRDRYFRGSNWWTFYSRVNTCNNVSYMHKTEWILEGSSNWCFNFALHYNSKHCIGILPMVCCAPYHWYIEHPKHGMSKSLLCYYEAPTHDISNHLPMAYWTPYPWYIKPPTNGIFTSPFPW